jgi:gluconate 2-dehydrogenase alpha chain
MTIVNEEVDAVIVGLGWTGAIMAKELSDAGLRVVALERGDDPGSQTGSQHSRPVDELEGSVHRKYIQSLSHETVTIRHSIADRAVPYRQIGSFKPGAGVGGAGAHWSGSHFRALPEDLNLSSYLEQRFGSSFVPEDMSIRDFPVTYDELEPHFDFFEKVCGTTGKAGVLNGARQDGGNPFEGSRSHEFPLPPNKSHLGAELFNKVAKDAGYHPYPHPASNASATYVNPYGCRMGPCKFSGFCSDYFCLNDAKASPNLSILPALQQSDGFEYRTRAQVLKVNLDSAGNRATGVTYLDAEGRECEQRASLVLLCAFSLFNVHLMLVSGIGAPYDPSTGHGTVGSNYTYQNVGRLNMFFDKDVQANAFIGIGAGGAVFDDLNGKQLDNAEAGFLGGGIISARQPGTGPVRGIPLPPGTPQWGSQWKQAVADYFCHSFYYEIQASCMPYRDRYLDLDPNYRDAYGRPLLRVTFNWHDNETRASRFLVDKALEMVRPLNPVAIRSDAKMPGAKYNAAVYQTSHNNGGAVSGDNPRSSALNRYLQSWDVHNVFVIGANAFPQTSAYNPTGLVGALAYWSAKAIREQYLKHPGPMVPT